MAISINTSGPFLLIGIDSRRDAQDMTFDEMREIIETAERAANDRLYEIRKRKTAKAPRRVSKLLQSPA